MQKCLVGVYVMTLETFMQIFDKILIEVGDHFDIYYENNDFQEGVGS